MSLSPQSLRTALGSPVGRKVLTGVTGIGLVLFVIVHMVGNLTYLSPDPAAYNTYAHKLLSFGWLFYALEIGLLAFFVTHIVVAITVTVRNRRARPQGYKSYKGAGRPSRMGLSSRTMIFTGVVLLIFLVLHLNSFKFGPGMEEGYVAAIEGGEEVRDLQRLMTEKFQEPLYAFGYPLVMLLLGFHLRHGVWSALQSVGWMNPRLTPVVYGFAAVLGLLVAVGFLVVPLYIYFNAGP